MKNTIHPQYFAEATVICACGHTFTTGSTKQEIHVEICSSCHPFYTGKTKLIDTAGRLQKFTEKKERSAQVAAAKTTKKPRKTQAEKATVQ